MILFAHARVYFNKSRGPHDCGWAPTGRRSLYPSTVTTGFRMTRIQDNTEKKQPIAPSSMFIFPLNYFWLPLAFRESISLVIPLNGGKFNSSIRHSGFLMVPRLFTPSVSSRQILQGALAGICQAPQHHVGQTSALHTTVLYRTLLQ